jgi:hypothetical protein
LQRGTYGLVRCSGVCACPATPAVVASYIAEAECDNLLEELFVIATAQT